MSIAVRKFRIIHVVLDLHEGGLERIVIELVRHAADSGHQPHVVCVRRAGQLARELHPGQFSVLPRQSRLSMVIPVALSMMLRRLRPDVIHLHSGVWYKGAYASRLAGVNRIVFTDHGRPHPDPLAHQVLDRIGAYMSNRIVAVSAPLAQYLADQLHVSHTKLRVVPNGILLPEWVAAEEVATARKELSISGEAQVIGTVGRLDPVKAYDGLIVAFAELIRSRVGVLGSPLVLLLVGDGPERSRLERLAHAAGVADVVQFLGWRNDVRRILRLMDVFVLPSDSEGTSLSLLEAMASGTAVVATAVGGTPDVIGDSGAGLLIPPRDHAALVGAIGTLLADPARQASMGAKGRARVERRYSFHAMAQAYHSLYTELLDNG